MVVGFAFGFGLARAGRGNGGQAAAPTTTSTVALRSSTTSEPVTTSTGPATSTSTSTTTTTLVTPSTSTTTAPPSTSSAPTTTREVTTTTAPPAPALLLVDYARDASGRLVLPRGGTAAVTISNVGGKRQQWLLAGFGYVSANGVSGGTLEPGVSVTALVAPLPGATAGTVGTLTVLGAGPNGSTSITTVVA